MKKDVEMILFIEYFCLIGGGLVLEVLQFSNWTLTCKELERCGLLSLSLVVTVKNIFWFFQRFIQFVWQIFLGVLWWHRNYGVACNECSSNNSLNFLSISPLLILREDVEYGEMIFHLIRRHKKWDLEIGYYSVGLNTQLKNGDERRRYYEEE